MKKTAKGEVLYVRISKTNKHWLDKIARQKGLSMSDYVNLLCTELRTGKDTPNEPTTDSFQAQFR